MVLIVPVFALADQTSPPNLLPPDLIVTIIQFLQTIPKVGPVIVLILKAIAIIAPVMTALSVMVQGVLAVPQIAARFSGATALADKIKYFSAKIIYWLSYLSIRNAEPVKNPPASLAEAVQSKSEKANEPVK